MNIVLIGYRCSGKTTVGNIIASHLGREFMDTDNLIMEETACPIDRIIQRRGWDYFRRLESRIIKRVARNRHAVIATGGIESPVVRRDCQPHEDRVQDPFVRLIAGRDLADRRFVIL